jgi:hypothetical protein
VAAVRWLQPQRRPIERISPAARADTRTDSSSYRELLAHRAVDPPPSSSLAEEERLRSRLLRAAARDSRRSQLVAHGRAETGCQAAAGTPAHQWLRSIETSSDFFLPE